MPVQVIQLHQILPEFIKSMFQMGFIKALGTPFLKALGNNILYWASCTTSGMVSFFLNTYLSLLSPLSDSSHRFPGSWNGLFITDVMCILFPFSGYGVTYSNPVLSDDVKAAVLELPTWLACSCTGESLPHPQSLFTVSLSPGKGLGNLDERLRAPWDSGAVYSGSLMSFTYPHQEAMFRLRGNYCATHILYTNQFLMD